MKKYKQRIEPVEVEREYEIFCDTFDQAKAVIFWRAEKEVERAHKSLKKAYSEDTCKSC